jgi:hypothetical protein
MSLLVFLFAVLFLIGMAIGAALIVMMTLGKGLTVWRSIRRVVIIARPLPPTGVDGSAQPRRRMSVGRPTGRLADAAVFLLPAADRARYAEEFRSELWDLAEAGAGRVQRARYGFRQLMRAVAMRRTLRSPRRRSAVR